MAELVVGVRVVVVVVLGVANVVVLAVVGRGVGPASGVRALDDAVLASRDVVVLVGVLLVVVDIGALRVTVEAGFMALLAEVVGAVLEVVVVSLDDTVLAVVGRAGLVRAVEGRAAVVGLGVAVLTGVVWLLLEAAESPPRADDAAVDVLVKRDD